MSESSLHRTFKNGDDIHFNYNEQPSTSQPAPSSGNKKKKRKKKTKSSKMELDDLKTIEALEDPFMNNRDGEFPESRVIKISRNGDVSVEHTENDSNLKLVNYVRGCDEELFQFQEDAERKFWLELSEDEKRKVVHLDKATILETFRALRKAMRNENTDESCLCVRCGRNSQLVEDELESFYGLYLNELSESMYLMPNPEAVILNLVESLRSKARKLQERSQDNKERVEIGRILPPQEKDENEPAEALEPVSHIGHHDARLEELQEILDPHEAQVADSQEESDILISSVEHRPQSLSGTQAIGEEPYMRITQQMLFKPGHDFYDPRVDDAPVVAAERYYHFVSEYELQVDEDKFVYLMCKLSAHWVSRSVGNSEMRGLMVRKILGVCIRTSSENPELVSRILAIIELMRAFFGGSDIFGQTMHILTSMASFILKNASTSFFNIKEIITQMKKFAMMDTTTGEDDQNFNATAFERYAMATTEDSLPLVQEICRGEIDELHLDKYDDLLYSQNDDHGPYEDEDGAEEDEDEEYISECGSNCDHHQCEHGDADDCEDDHDHDHNHDHHCGHCEHDHDHDHDHDHESDQYGYDTEEDVELAHQERMEEIRGFFMVQAMQVIKLRFRESYLKKISEDRTQQFIQELEAEESAKKEKELKKLKQKEKQKEKKRLQQLAKEEERKRKEEEEHLRLAEIAKKQEELRAEQLRKKDELRLKKEETKRKRIEELKRKEEEAKKREAEALREKLEKQERKKDLEREKELEQQAKQQDDLQNQELAISSKIDNDIQSLLKYESIVPHEESKQTLAQVGGTTVPLPNFEEKRNLLGAASTSIPLAGQFAGMLLGASDSNMANAAAESSSQNHLLHQLYLARPQPVSGISGTPPVFPSVSSGAQVSQSAFYLPPKTQQPPLSHNLWVPLNGAVSNSQPNVNTHGGRFLSFGLQDVSPELWSTGPVNGASHKNEPIMTRPVMTSQPSLSTESLWSSNYGSRNNSIWNSGNPTTPSRWSNPAASSHIPSVISNEGTVHVAALEAFQILLNSHQIAFGMADVMSVFTITKRVLNNQSLQLSEFLKDLHSSQQFEFVYDEFGSVTHLKLLMDASAPPIWSQRASNSKKSSDFGTNMENSTQSLAQPGFPSEAPPFPSLLHQMADQQPLNLSFGIHPQMEQTSQSQDLQTQNRNLFGLLHGQGFQTSDTLGSQPFLLDRSSIW